jgi:hypothetical protein
MSGKHPPGVEGARRRIHRKRNLQPIRSGYNGFHQLPICGKDRILDRVAIVPFTFHFPVGNAITMPNDCQEPQHLLSFTSNLPTREKPTSGPATHTWGKHPLETSLPPGKFDRGFPSAAAIKLGCCAGALHG